GTYYPLENLQTLSGQMVSLRKKFTSYKAFAGKSVEDVLGKDQLRKATKLEVFELRSGYLENQEGRFQYVPFGADMQLAPVTSLLSHDFNGDGKVEILAAGNYFGVKPYHG